MGERPSARTPDQRDVVRPHRAFGSALLSARMNLRLSRPQVAEKAEVKYPMLANVEAGRRRASDEIIHRLAPVLGLRADRMIQVRDAMEADAMAFPPGIGIRGYMAGEKDSLPGLDDTPGLHPEWQVQALLADVLVKEQEVEVLTYSTRPPSESLSSPRMQTAGNIMRDLRDLEDEDLAKVEGFVSGLKAARERVRTAIDPLAKWPLIKVPSAPFGPHQTWPTPEWLMTVPGSEQAIEDVDRLWDRWGMLVTQARRDHSPGHPIAEIVQESLDTLQTNEGVAWPPVERVIEAALAGLRLARPERSTPPGFVEPNVWLKFLEFRPRSIAGDDLSAVVMDWVFRITFIGKTTRPNGPEGVRSFVRECMDFAPELVPAAR